MLSSHTRLLTRHNYKLSLRNGITTRLLCKAWTSNRHDLLYRSSYSSTASRFQDEENRLTTTTQSTTQKIPRRRYTAQTNTTSTTGKIGPKTTSNLKWDIPQRIHEKVISAEDAVALVQNGDTVAVSGFVCQGSPEGLLKALGERFQATQEPKDLTLFFGGGPGDYGERGLSHLAKVSEDGQTQMLKRTIGG